MALPKLNDKPKYEMKITSTKEEVRFRPFLVKEEKVLMIAMESEDTRQILNAVVDTLDACIEGGVNKTKLTTFDVEYMFTKLRSKSVGEVATLAIECSHCNTKNEVTANLEGLDLVVPDDIEHVIEIDEGISLEMQWPSYLAISDLDNLDVNNTMSAFKILSCSLAFVITEDERIDMREVSEDEIQAFIESMNREQFLKVQQYLDSMPKLSHDIEFTCENCKKSNTQTLEGMASFF